MSDIVVGKSFSQIELKSEGKKEAFEKKLSDIKETGQISRADFQKLAKDVSGGSKSLADFLVKNDIVPKDNIKTLTSKPFFEIAKNAKVLVQKANLTELLKDDKAIDVFKKDGTLEVPKDQAKTVTGPALLGKITKNVTIGNVELKKDMPFVLHQKDGKTMIQTGTKDNENNIKLENTFIEVKDKSELLKLKGASKINENDYKKVTTPLFEKPISTKDIKQGGLGDCFLISGIYSIAKTNPKAIQDMMKDNGDGTVTVKLYDTNKDTNKLEPKYIRLEKSIPKGDEKANDTLWVQMLEKAYATHIGSYQSISNGGQTNHVFEAFLGKSASLDRIDVGDKNISSIIPKGMEISDFSISQLKKQKDTLGLDDTDIKIVEKLKEKGFDSQKYMGEIKSIITEDPEVSGLIKATLGLKVEDKIKPQDVDRIALKVANKTFDFFNEKQLFETLLKDNKAFESIKDKPVILQSDFDNIVKELKVNFADEGSEVKVGSASFKASDVIKRFEKSGKDMFPLDSTSSKTNYSPLQDDLFKKITDSIANKENVGAATKNKIGVAKGVGAHGEEKVDGLAGKHAYAVLDTVEMGGRKFVRVANPWGNDFSRDYSMKNGELVSKEFNKKDYSHLPDSDNKKGAGIGINESWMELRDFANQFDSFYYTKT